MYIRDTRREPGMTKLPPMPKMYLYPEARRRFPQLPSQTLASLEHAMAGKYKALRYNLLWTGSVSLPNCRYPVPFPVPAQAWRAKWDKDGSPLVELRLGDSRWTLRLRGGPHFRRQTESLAQIISGEAIPGELSIFRKKASRSDHRSGLIDRDAGGGRSHFRLIAKFVAHLPRKSAVSVQVPKSLTLNRTSNGASKGTNGSANGHANGNGSATSGGVMTLRTGSDFFFRAEMFDRENAWTLHADHVRRWQQDMQRRQRRLAMDLGEDKTHSSRTRKRMQVRADQLAEKQYRRHHAWCHEATSLVAKYARKQAISTIVYDDADRSYLREFPWYMLGVLLRDKLDERGIQVQMLSDVKRPR